MNAMGLDLSQLFAHMAAILPFIERQYLCLQRAAGIFKCSQ